MRIFIIGITGGVGSRLARSPQQRGDTVSGLARRAGPREELRAAGVDAKPGDLTTITSREFAELIGDVDAIAFTAGAGGTGDTATIDRDGVGKAIDAARVNGVDRLGLVSVFAKAWRERKLGVGFDHYIAMKKDADVALTQSGLDWIIVRPAVLLDAPGRGTVALGPAQIHGDIPRQDVADTLAALLHEPRITQQILELTQGGTPIAQAVEANIRTRRPAAVPASRGSTSSTSRPPTDELQEDWVTTSTRTIFMTGATRGIGLEAAREILRRSPETHLVVLGRGSFAAEVLPDLRDVSPHVSTVDIDLSSRASVAAAGAQLENRLDSGELPPLRGLVFNAGVHLSSALETTVDGYERTFAVNVMSTHQLLSRLHPCIRAPARIVVTVSNAHFGDLRHTGGTMPAPRWSIPEISRPGAFDRSGSVRAGRRAYVTSKLGGVHLVHEWARRPDGIDIVSYNPSLVVGTGLARETGGAFPFLMSRIIPWLTVTPLVDTPVPAGRKLADAVLGVTPAATGAYIHRTKATASSAESYDADRERVLWDWLEQVPRATT